MKYFWVIFSFAIVSCNGKVPKDVPSNTLPSGDSFKEKLLGYWGGLDTDLPAWKITSDSIHYYDENKTYPYQIIGDDMVIDRTGSKLTFSNISIIADTLIFYPHGPDSETRIFRIKRSD